MASIRPITMISRHGLANVGNTCYLNSVIRALSFSKPFVEYFGTEVWKEHAHSDRKGHMLANETSTLITALAEPGTKLIVPTGFVKAFIEFAGKINETIRYGAQADAPEAILILMDGLHMQVAREVHMDISGEAKNEDQAELIKSLESWSAFYSKEYSALIEKFYGQTQTKVVCENCKACSTRYEPWGILKAAIPGAETQGSPAPTLYECVASVLEVEKIDVFECAACKVRGPASRSDSISRFPQYLILALKRFTNTGAKVRARIPYDEDNIDLSQWRSWPNIQAPPVYRVTSTIEHLGGSQGGHYCMRTRDPSGEWLVYDDARIEKSSIGGAAGPDTYVLFLELI